MAGGHRSTGCLTCIRRKIKCDEGKPLCRNCAKSGWTCPGYRESKAQKFVDETAKTTARHSARSTTAAGKTRGRRPKVRSSSEPPALERQETENSSQAQSIGQQSDSIIPNQQDFPLFEDGALAAVSDDVKYLYEAQRQVRNSLGPFTILSSKESIFEASVRAVVLAHHSRLRGSAAIAEAALPYYGKALRLLNLALQEESNSFSTETLAATVLLSFYEMFTAELQMPWVKHARGVAALIKVRGARRHRQGIDRDIFLAYRHVLIVEAFQMSKPCFLDEEEWRDLAGDIRNDLLGEPYREIFEAAEEYYGKVVHIPRLLVDAAQAQSQVSENHELIHDIIIRVIDTRNALTQAFINLVAASNKHGYGIAYDIEKRTPPVFELPQYTNINVASLHTSYWSVRMRLNLLLLELFQKQPQSEGNLGPSVTVRDLEKENRHLAMLEITPAGHPPYRVDLSALAILLNPRFGRSLDHHIYLGLWSTRNVFECLEMSYA